MKKLITWIAAHCAHWAILYMAFFAHIDGALYILKFFAWAMVFISPVLLTDIAKDRGAKETPTPVRAVLSRVQSWCTLLALVWFGHIATAVAWVFVMLCCALYREGVKKIRADKLAVAA